MVGVNWDTIASIAIAQLPALVAAIATVAAGVKALQKGLDGHTKTIDAIEAKLSTLLEQWKDTPDRIASIEKHLCVVQEDVDIHRENWRVLLSHVGGKIAEDAGLSPKDAEEWAKSGIVERRRHSEEEKA